MSNPFIRDLKTYTRDIDVVNNYIKQASFIVHKEHKISIEEAKEKVITLIKSKKIKIPHIDFSDRDKNQDTIRRTTPITTYLKDVTRDKNIIVPTWTVYKRPSVLKSCISGYVDQNLTLRKADKKSAFKAKSSGYLADYVFFNTLQKTRKLKNNALSGGFATHSAVQNPSAHSALTSTTRMTASIGNMITESVLAGNRAYMSPEDVFNHIATLLTTVDKDEVKTVMKKYKMVSPDADYVIKFIKRSTSRYFIDLSFDRKLEKLIDSLDELERAIVVFTQNLFDIRELNPILVRTIIDKLASEDSGYADKEDEVFERMEGFEKNHLHYVLSNKIKGQDLDIKKLRGTPLHDIYISTLYSIQKTLDNIEDFIKAFFSQPILPMRVSKMKEMLRDTIVLSDTDSTCATYDNFVEWMIGKDYNPNKEVAITGAVGIFVSESLVDLLRQFVSHMGIEEQDKHKLSMKNEYYWSVFLPANVAKHYIALTKIIEGNILTKGEIERKGANLIASTLSPFYGEKLLEFISDVLEDFDKKKPVSVMDYVKRISDIETEIHNKIINGDSDVFRLDTIKSFESYKSDKVERTNYYHHELWNDIFGEKYGNSPDPQYIVYKVNVKLDNEKAMVAWLESIKDVSIREKAERFLKKYKKNKIGMLRLPKDRIDNDGIPEELVPLLDTQVTIDNTIKPFFIVLELLGVNPIHGVLLKDQFDL